MILTDGDTILPRNLNLSFRPPREEPSAAVDPWVHIDLSGTLSDASRRVLAEVERRKIVQTLAETEGNKVRASELLQVTYKTFLMKLKEHGIE